MGSVSQHQRIVVQIARRFKDIDFSQPRLKRLVRGVCTRFRLPRATVSIAVVDNAEIRAVNKRFLNRGHSTDCLSFDLSDDEAPDPPLGSRLLEVVVNGQKAVKEASVRGHSSEAELALYVTHGLLHKLGFDDSTEQKAKRMHRLEDEILRQFGYGLLYDSRGGQES